MATDKEQSLKQIMDFRLEKLEKLRKLGVNAAQRNDGELKMIADATPTDNVIST